MLGYAALTRRRCERKVICRQFERVEDDMDSGNQDIDAYMFFSSIPPSPPIAPFLYASPTTQANLSPVV